MTSGGREYDFTLAFTAQVSPGDLVFSSVSCLLIDMAMPFAFKRALAGSALIQY